MALIKRKEVLSPGVNLFEIVAPLIARKRKAGQFIVLRIDEPGERIPLTIADAKPGEGTITLVVQEVGKSTAKLATLEEGDEILNIVGPLGTPTHINNYGVVCCIGGGIGVAPVLPIARAMKEAQNEVISIMGAREKGLLILENQMRQASDRLLISTDDGSYGYHGFVSDVLRNLIEEEGQEINIVVAIGPVPMMRAVCGVTKAYNLKTIVSLNPIMVDASGMCGACRVTVGGKTRFVCVDGPEFDGHEVDFDELVKRQRMYLDKEKISMSQFFHKDGPCLGG